MTTIQVFRPSYDERELEALREPFETGWIGLGPKTAEFERKFARYVGAPYAVAMNSATAALHLSLVGLGIGDGDEVLVPTMTFVSTAHAVRYTGAVPVFCDIDRDTLNIDVKDAASRVTPQTKAIIPVHFGGHPCDMEAIWELADRERLMVIEDAAHACGSRYRGQMIGGLESDATCFSFHAVKNLATGDGGMVTTAHEWLDRKLRKLRWCGIDKDTWKRTKDLDGGYGWYYEIERLGYKCHMNDIAASIGLVQLEKLDSTNAVRWAVAKRYSEAFARLRWLKCPVVPPEPVLAHHNYVIKTPYRDELNLWLRERDIYTGVHYMPIHLQPYYKRSGVRLPMAEEVWPRLLTLPLYPDLTDGDVERVIDGVLEFGKEKGL